MKRGRGRGYSSKSVMALENMWWSLGSVSACRSLKESLSVWFIRNSQSLCYRTGKFLFLVGETTLVSLPSMTLTLYQPQIDFKYEWGTENRFSGVVFPEKEIVVTRMKTSRKCRSIKVVLNTFKVSGPETVSCVTPDSTRKGDGNHPE